MRPLRTVLAGLLMVGLAESILVGWVFKVDKLVATLNEGSRIRLGSGFAVLIRWIIPAMLLVLLALLARPVTRWTTRDLGRLAALPRGLAIAAEAGAGADRSPAREPPPSCAGSTGSATCTARAATSAAGSATSAARSGASRG